MVNNTKIFIREHADDDVRELALQADRYKNIDMKFALEQIAGRQRARSKIPSWAEIDDILYPPHISLEQCSSEFTARYKASVMARLLSSCKNSNTKEEEIVFADLTGGLGVDFHFIAKAISEQHCSKGKPRLVYVEKQSHLCDYAQNNFLLLGIPNVEIINSDGVDYLHDAEKMSVIYLDPARRDDNGSKTYAISDCTPDVESIGRELTEKSDFTVIKLSPMLDVNATIDVLDNAVAENSDKPMHDKTHVMELHIVSSGNECKEMLVVISRNTVEKTHVFCINDNESLDYYHAKTQHYAMSAAAVACGNLSDYSFLYEPNASVMKAGCFSLLSDIYDMKALGRNSHLFVSNVYAPDFQGRKFDIISVSSLNKKETKRSLAGISKANIAIRNFPLSVAELRKRLKIGDGGDVYIFATTTEDSRHLLIVCRKKTL